MNTSLARAAPAVGSAVRQPGPTIPRVERPAADHALTLIAARSLVGDLFQRRAAVYWIDLLVTPAIGYSAAAVYLTAGLPSPLQLTSFVVCGFALLRAGSFVHEIAHMRAGEMLGFRVGWNLLCGIPMVLPSHIYENHVDHHNSRRYGTIHDGEYLPLALGPLRKIFWFIAQVPLLPAGELIASARAHARRTASTVSA